MVALPGCLYEDSRPQSAICTVQLTLFELFPRMTRLIQQCYFLNRSSPWSRSSIYMPLWHLPIQQANTVMGKIIRLSSDLCTHASNYQWSCRDGIVTAGGSYEKAFLHLEQLRDVAGLAARHAELYQTPHCSWRWRVLHLRICSCSSPSKEALGAINKTEGSVVHSIQLQWDLSPQGTA